MARQEMLDRFGMAAYNDGYRVYTTVDSELQQVARSALVRGLKTYDARHGFRGPERQLAPAVAGEDATGQWLQVLAETAVIADLQPAIVTSIAQDRVQLLLADGESDELLWENAQREATP